MNPKRVFLILVVAALVGFSIFVYLLSRVSHMEQASAGVAQSRIDSVRALYEDPTPVMVFGEARKSVPDTTVAKIETLHVLVYRGPMQGLLQVDVPIWFIRLKAPAAQFMLRRTDVDLEELGLTAGVLRSYGPSIVADEKRPNGDRLFMWTDAQ
jgi:hypothetical protein